jgi:hypothetical protein
MAASRRKAHVRHDYEPAQSDGIEIKQQVHLKGPRYNGRCGVRMCDVELRLGCCEAVLRLRYRECSLNTLSCNEIIL